MRALHVWQEETRRADGAVHRTLILEPRHGERILSRREIRFRITSDGPIPDTPTLDHAVAALIPVAMTVKLDLVVHGPVCATLLSNMEEFQAVWQCWAPELFTRVAITADQEVTTRPAVPPRQAIAAFSGGVDGAFTVWRHRFQKDGRRPVALDRVVLIHGFDVPLTQPGELAAVEASARAMLEGLGIGFRVVRTNLKDALPDWRYSFMAVLAGCLHQFAGEARLGLIASDESYPALVWPWGSHPVALRLLSSGAFQFRHDGGDRTRTEKVAALATWPAALHHLRACWYPRGGRNCGRCGKCLRTILNFRLAGVGLPPCFDRDVTDQEIAATALTTAPQLALFQEIHDAARARGIQDGWVAAVAQAVAQADLAGGR